MVQQFKEGDFNTLVSTSVLEEGMDIGEVDLIVCYDVTTPGRMVQRMGRTGRKRTGCCKILLTEGKAEQQYLQREHANTRTLKNIRAALGPDAQPAGAAPARAARHAFAFYPDNPRMLPPGVTPAVHKTHMHPSSPAPAAPRPRSPAPEPDPAPGGLTAAEAQYLDTRYPGPRVPPRPPASLGAWVQPLAQAAAWREAQATLAPARTVPHSNFTMGLVRLLRDLREHVGLAPPDAGRPEEGHAVRTDASETVRAASEGQRDDATRDASPPSDRRQSCLGTPPLPVTAAATPDLPPPPAPSSQTDGTATATGPIKRDSTPDHKIGQSALSPDPDAAQRQPWAHVLDIAFGPPVKWRPPPVRPGEDRDEPATPATPGPPQYYGAYPDPARLSAGRTAVRAEARHCGAAGAWDAGPLHFPLITAATVARWYPHLAQAPGALDPPPPKRQRPEPFDPFEPALDGPCQTLAPEAEAGAGAGAGGPPVPTPASAPAPAAPAASSAPLQSDAPPTAPDAESQDLLGIPPAPHPPAAPPGPMCKFTGCTRPAAGVFGSGFCQAHGLFPGPLPPPAPAPAPPSPAASVDSPAPEPDTCRRLFGDAAEGPDAALGAGAAAVGDGTPQAPPRKLPTRRSGAPPGLTPEDRAAAQPHTPDPPPPAAPRPPPGTAPRRAHQSPVPVASPSPQSRCPMCGVMCPSPGHLWQHICSQARPFPSQVWHPSPGPSPGPAIGRRTPAHARDGESSPELFGTPTSHDLMQTEFFDEDETATEDVCSAGATPPVAGRTAHARPSHQSRGQSPGRHLDAAKPDADPNRHPRLSPHAGTKAHPKSERDLLPKEENSPSSGPTPQAIPNADPRGASSSSSSALPDDVQILVDMGFSQAHARRALGWANGDIAGAAELLLGASQSPQALPSGSDGEEEQPPKRRRVALGDDAAQTAGAAAEVVDCDTEGSQSSAPGVAEEQGKARAHTRFALFGANNPTTARVSKPPASGPSPGPGPAPVFSVALSSGRGPSAAPPPSRAPRPVKTTVPPQRHDATVAQQPPVPLLADPLLQRGSLLTALQGRWHVRAIVHPLRGPHFCVSLDAVGFAFSRADLTSRMPECRGAVQRAQAAVPRVLVLVVAAASDSPHVVQRAAQACVALATSPGAGTVSVLQCRDAPEAAARLYALGRAEAAQDRGLPLGLSAAAWQQRRAHVELLETIPALPVPALAEVVGRAVPLRALLTVRDPETLCGLLRSVRPPAAAAIVAYLARCEGGGAAGAQGEAPG